MFKQDDLWDCVRPLSKNDIDPSILSHLKAPNKYKCVKQRNKLKLDVQIVQENNLTSLDPDEEREQMDKLMDLY